MSQPALTIRVVRPMVAAVIALATVLAAAVGPWAAPSPGKILFVRRDPATGLAGLYSVRPNGAGLRRIVPGLRSGGVPADLQSARWSPDGKRVAFAYLDTGVYIANADGTSPHRLASGDVRDVDWAPDSRRLVFDRVAAAGEAIYVAAVGAAPRRLVAVPSGDDALKPAWSPDGRTIAYVLAGDALPANTEQVWVVNPDGSGNRRVASGRSITAPDWSSNSVWIGYASFVAVASDIYLVRRDGTGARRLTRSDRVAYGPHWAPTGNALAYLVYVGESPQVVVQRTPDSPPQRVDNDDAATHLSGYPGPLLAWSPDATRLVFYRRAEPATDAEQGLYVKTIGAPGIRKILGGYDGPLDWR
jgi:Tol biopolymer transport system component